MQLEDLTIGDRVELRPEANPWLGGVCCGIVTAIGRDNVELRLEAIVFSTRVSPGNVARILERSQEEVTPRAANGLDIARPYRDRISGLLTGAIIAAAIAWLVPHG
jgi:hypothetical protein